MKKMLMTFVVAAFALAANAQAPCKNNDCDKNKTEQCNQKNAPCCDKDGCACPEDSTTCVEACKPCDAKKESCTQTCKDADKNNAGSCSKQDRQACKSACGK